MTPERATFLRLLRARVNQRCPGEVNATHDFDAGRITIACSVCGARLVLPLRRPGGDPEDTTLARLLMIVMSGAWRRWRARYGAGATYGSAHPPVQRDEEPVPSTVRIQVRE